jgi:hypothetical protein
MRLIAPSSVGHIEPHLRFFRLSLLDRPGDFSAHQAYAHRQANSPTESAVSQHRLLRFPHALSGSRGDEVGDPMQYPSAAMETGDVVMPQRLEYREGAHHAGPKQAAPPRCRAVAIALRNSGHPSAPTPPPVIKPRESAAPAVVTVNASKAPQMMVVRMIHPLRGRPLAAPAEMFGMPLFVLFQPYQVVGPICTATRSEGLRGRGIRRARASARDGLRYMRRRPLPPGPRSPRSGC